MTRVFGLPPGSIDLIVHKTEGEAMVNGAKVVEGDRVRIGDTYSVSGVKQFIVLYYRRVVKENGR